MSRQKRFKAVRKILYLIKNNKMEKKDAIRLILDRCEMSIEKEAIKGLFNSEHLIKDDAVFKLCGVEIYRTAWSDEMTESDIENGIANAYSGDALEKIWKVAFKYEDVPGCSRTIDFLHREKARRELAAIIQAEQLQMA